MATTISKNKTAKVNTKSGKEYSYKYVDIAQIHEYLESIDAKYIQKIQRIDNDDYVMTKRCFDNTWEDEWLQGSKVVDATLFGTDNPAQKQGSALTYARRYSLLMAFGLATDDDDAQSLTKPSITSVEEAKAYCLTFGKHTGKTLGEVPKSYLDWLIKNGNDETIKNACTMILEEDSEDVGEKGKLLEYLQKLVIDTGTDYERLLGFYKVKSDANLSIEQINEAIKTLEARLR